MRKVRVQIDKPKSKVPSLTPPQPKSPQVKAWTFGWSLKAYGPPPPQPPLHPNWDPYVW